MTEDQLAFLLGEATALLTKRIDMLKHGFRIQETDLMEIRQLLSDADAHLRKSTPRGKSNAEGARFDRTRYS